MSETALKSEHRVEHFRPVQGHRVECGDSGERRHVTRDLQRFKFSQILCHWKCTVIGICTLAYMLCIERTKY